MCIITDFNNLYTHLAHTYNLDYQLSCHHHNNTPLAMANIKTYFCCAVSVPLKKCVLHNCVVVIVGTWLDKRFRGDECNYGFEGTFILDGRHFSFPNIMMNNNVLIHNFFDKQYARDKKMKRMFLYGNYDDDKTVNRAIQLVYDKVDDVLYVRDVYAKDYIVDSGINQILREYLKCSGKWPDMDFVFSFDDYTELFDTLKSIMSVDIPYQIDSLSNKIIYKHSYLIHLTYSTVLNKLRNLTVTDADNTKKKCVLFATESKKINDTIVMGKLIQSVSKTLSKQKKYDQEYNSNNNNLEIFPLRHRIGNEVLRVINENLQQDMLKHTADYIKFVDSFFHGEMTVAGKKFFLCHNVVLPDVDYKRVSLLFRELIHKNVLYTKKVGGEDESELTGEKVKILNFSKKSPNKVGLVSNSELVVAFNNRPTKYYCNRDSLYQIYYTMKRGYAPVEIKLTNNILFVNHHEGMVMLKRVVYIDNEIHIKTLQTAYEYHNEHSLLNSEDVLLRCDETGPMNTTASLMSTMVLEYYKNYLHIFNTIPVAKLIVSLTNLKNGMVVQKKGFKSLPVGNSVVVEDSVYCNDRMFCLWTVVMDSRLKTAEDPYVPHARLPIKIYHNKINRIKGKVSGDNNEFVYEKSGANNIIEVEGGNCLCMFGTLLCNNKINWNHDGKKYKIEFCTSKQWCVYKFYMYFRKVGGQVVERVDSEMTTDESGSVFVKLEMVYSVSDLEGLKICGVHGQKGVLHEAEDLSRFVAEDDASVHAQICLSPISYLSRQTNFNQLPVKYCRVNGERVPLVLIPYMFFNNTPDNIYKEFIGKNITGYEKLEGTRLDQWSINQSFVGNRLAEGLHCVRNGNNSVENSGQYNVFQTLLHCNNIKVVN
uniref:Lef-8 n=1 Tax=Cydia pomonella granulosis virus TaxID=28289 RepID=A0A097P0W6_GVCP|nr:ORF131 lef-8 [Cydia pomonella granulovirus]AIU37056.1 ORF131 lef-8 [Cydia pomonella granulovirus]QDW81190.1 lef-8 [Cydia pomonella granulovirus]QGY99261.1 LEF-8 [Cydia pomonella granulovirus]QGY99403.1 LEF-8 [Cydia pomonella granulovirus]